MNWGEIKQLAVGFIHRKDISFDELQPLALDDINQNLTVQENEAVTTLVLAASNAISGLSEAPLPVDFARPRAAFNENGELTPIDIQGLIAARPVTNGYYAISGKKFYAGGAGDVPLVYSARYERFSDNDESNDLTDRYSQVLLYALVKHAAHRIQDFDAQKEHQAEFDMQVSVANANYALSTLSAGIGSRSPYGKVGN